MFGSSSESRSKADPIGWDTLVVESDMELSLRIAIRRSWMDRDGCRALWPPQ